MLIPDFALVKLFRWGFVTFFQRLVTGGNPGRYSDFLEWRQVNPRESRSWPVRGNRGASLAEDPVCRKYERKTRLIPVAGSRCVLEQPDVVHQDVAGHRPSGILVTRILIVDAERHPGVDGDVVERNLVALRRHWLERDGGKVPPAGMGVGGADSVRTTLRCGWQIGSPHGRAEKHDTDGTCLAWRRGFDDWSKPSIARVRAALAVRIVLSGRVARVDPDISVDYGNFLYP